MGNIGNAKAQAEVVKDKCEEFFSTFSSERQLDFRSAFHLRPTSSGVTTVVSTLPFAPMRGLTKIKNDSLLTILHTLNNLKV